MYVLNYVCFLHDGHTLVYIFPCFSRLYFHFLAHINHIGLSEFRSVDHTRTLPATRNQHSSVIYSIYQYARYI